MKSRICTILCLLTLLGFIAVFVQEHWRPFNIKPLDGYTTTTDKPELNLATFESGDYQSDIEQYISENFGFREFFIRVYNQYSYTCFHQINNDNIVEGLDHELFTHMYLNDISGTMLEEYYTDVSDYIRMVLRERMSGLREQTNVAIDAAAQRAEPGSR